jgi:hypothetical protein
VGSTWWLAWCCRSSRSERRYGSSRDPLVSLGQEWGWASVRLLPCIAAAVAAIGGSVLVERRAPHLIVDLGLFRNRVLTSAGVSMTPAMLALFAITSSCRSREIHVVYGELTTPKSTAHYRLDLRIPLDVSPSRGIQRRRSRGDGP